MKAATVQLQGSYLSADVYVNGVKLPHFGGGTYTSSLLSLPPRAPLRMRVSVSVPNTGRRLHYQLLAPLGSAAFGTLQVGGLTAASVVPAWASLGTTSAGVPGNPSATDLSGTRGVDAPPDQQGEYETLSGSLSDTQTPKPTEPKVTVTVELPPTTLSNPTDERHIPLRVRLEDLEGEDSLESEIDFEIYYNGAWLPAEACRRGPGLVHAPTGGRDHTFVLDRMSPASPIANFVMTTPIRFRVSATSPATGVTTQGISDPLFVGPTGFAVLRSTPSDGEQGVFTDQSLHVRFTDSVAETSLSGNVELFETVSGFLVSAKLSVAGTILRVSPEVALTPNLEYSLRLKTGISSESLEPLVSERVIEFETGTGSGLADSDGDGVLDVVEQALGLDINLIDTDGDGFTDFEELHVLCSDPTDINNIGLDPPGAPFDPASPTAGLARFRHH